MNCWKGECKYLKMGVCMVSGKACDMTKKQVYSTGMHEYHCHQEENKELRGINPDTMFLDNIPEDYHLLPFWSCQNICRWYDTCEEI